MVNSFKVRRALTLVKKFADNQDLVSFGAIKPGEEHIAHILGITHQSRHQNLFYAHGTANGARDYSLLVRQFALTDSRNDPNTYIWVAMRFVLRVNDIPRIFIDSHQADNALYKQLVEVMQSFSHVSKALEASSPKFISQFHIFSALQDVPAVGNYLDAATMDQLLTYYPTLSLEMLSNQLIIYSDIKHLSSLRLDNMFRCGLWLSEKLEYADSTYHAHSES